MKINALKCNSCKDLIFSRARHDLHYCSCGKVAIDGGFDYLRVLGNAGDFDGQEIDLNVTRDELYDDWSNYQDKYGIIKEFENEQSS